MSAAAPLERLESRSNETRNETTEKSQMPRILSYPSGADTQNGRVLTPALKIIDCEHRTMNGFGLRGRQDLRMRSTERGTASAIAVRLCLMGLVTQIVLSGAAAAQSTQALERHGKRARYAEWSIAVLYVSVVVFILTCLSIVVDHAMGGSLNWLLEERS
jgi:hypothetical protein